jgi:hypothetical protein
MAFLPITLEVLQPALRELSERRRRGTVLTFAGHDLLLTGPMLQRYTPWVKPWGQLPVCAESEAIVDFHNALWLRDRRRRLRRGVVVETPAWFDRLGLEVRAYDLVRARGYEEILDVAQPFSSSEHERYDLVFDGILHQSFAPGTTLHNAAAAAKVGGWVVVQCVASGPNSGFYSVSPTTFIDFAREFGLQVESQRLVVLTGRHHEDQPFHPIHGHPLPHRTMQVVRLRKLSPTPPPTRWPTQSKFLLHPLSLAGKGAKPCSS